MTNTVNYRIFVYGTLRRGFHNPVYEYISRYFTFICMAKVKGNLVDMGTYPAGVPSTEEHFILGELYQAKEPDEFSWAIGQLDDYEGVSVEADEEQLYRRELADVYTDHEITQAWIYWFNGDVSGKPKISTGDMLEYIQQKK